MSYRSQTLIEKSGRIVLTLPRLFCGVFVLSAITSTSPLKAQSQFLSASTNGSGQMQSSLSGVSGTPYIVEASTNLRAWTPISILAMTNAPVAFVDLASASYSRRYYRARSSTNHVVADFESFSNGSTAMFLAPPSSSSTSQFLDGSSSLTFVTTASTNGHPGAYLVSSWTFISGTTNPWLRLTTSNAPRIPNPVIGLKQALQFQIFCNNDLYVTLGLRETNPSGAIGSDGGTTGTIEWVGGSTDNTTSPPKGRLVSGGRWATLTYFIPNEPVCAFTGNGILESTTGKAVLEHLCLVPGSGPGFYKIFLDQFQLIDLGP